MQHLGWIPGLLVSVCLALAGDDATTKAWFSTDRETYHPGDTVRFKAWASHVRYPADATALAGQVLNLHIAWYGNDPAYARELTADALGGVSDSFALPSDAKPGNYHLSIDDVAECRGGFTVVSEQSSERSSAPQRMPRDRLLGEEMDLFGSNMSAVIANGPLHIALPPSAPPAGYRPGDKVTSIITVDRPGVTVLLFPPLSRDASASPTLLHLTEASMAQTLTILPQDIPNLHVEAVCIADRRVFWPPYHQPDLSYGLVSNLDRLFENLLSQAERSTLWPNPPDTLVNQPPCRADRRAQLDIVRRADAADDAAREARWRMVMMRSSAPRFDESVFGARQAYANTTCLLWAPDVAFDTNGEAHVDVELPQEAKAWRVRVWAMATGTRVGLAETTLCVDAR